MSGPIVHLYQEEYDELIEALECKCECRKENGELRQAALLERIMKELGHE